MEKNPENEVVVLLHDMNGNELREGDLVMVQLEKPMLIGFITKVDEPSILTKEKRPGVVTVTGTVRLPFVPRQRQIMGQVAKLVNPAAEAFVNKLSESIRQGVVKKESVSESGADGKATGPTLVVESTDVRKEDDSPSAS